jgi:hypothetical protein
VDNVEHLYEPNLPPGRYALEVTGSQNDIEYGLAWYSVPTVTVAATTPGAAETGLAPGTFTFTRGGVTTAALVISYTVGGSATNGADYQAVPATVTIPAGANSATVTITPLADTRAEGDETVVLTLADDPAFSIAAASSATVTIRDLPIEAWRFSRFTAAELADPLLSGDLADFEKDGTSNLNEYALGLDPKASDTTGLPQATVQNNDSLAFTYTKVKSATDITYIAEVTNDLATWYSGAGYTSVLETIDHGTTISVKVGSLLAPDSPQRQFMRLRIARP